MGWAYRGLPGKARVPSGLGLVFPRRFCGLASRFRPSRQDRIHPGPSGQRRSLRAYLTKAGRSFIIPVDLDPNSGAFVTKIKRRISVLSILLGLAVAGGLGLGTTLLDAAMSAPAAEQSKTCDKPQVCPMQEKPSCPMETDGGTQEQDTI